MKVIYPANIRFPMERANSIQIINTCDALARAGLTVHLLVRRTDARNTKECLAFYGLAPHRNLVVHRLPVMGMGWGFSLAKRSFTLGALLHILTLKALGAVDLVYLRDLAIARVLLHYRRWLGLPVVYETHEISHIIHRDLHRHLADIPELDEKHVSRVEASERYVFTRADTLVAITRSLADLIQTDFSPRCPIKVIPDATHVGPLYDGARSKDVYYIGQLYPWKGVDTLIRAMALLPGRRLVVVGGLPCESDLDRLKRLSTQLGISDRVHFEGFVTPSSRAVSISSLANWRSSRLILIPRGLSVMLSAILICFRRFSGENRWLPRYLDLL